MVASFRLGLVNLLTLSVVPLGCIYFGPLAPLGEDCDVYSCFGSCEYCTLEDHSTDEECDEWLEVQGNPTDGSDEVPEYVQASSVDEATELCQEAFANNIAEAYEEYEIRNCVVSDEDGPAKVENSECETTAKAVSADIAGGYSRPDAQERLPQIPGLDASLSRTTLTVNPSNSTLSVTWRGATSSQSVRGWAQITEAPFALTYLLLRSESNFTFGSAAYEKPNVFLIWPLWGGMATNGDYSIPLPLARLHGAYKKGGYIEGAQLAYFLNSLTGNINYSSKTFSGNLSLKQGGDSATLSLSGTLTRPPVASFTVGSLSSCTVPVNGTGSSDPDGGSITRYAWKINGRPAGTGSTKSLPVKQGTNLIELRVTDNEDSVSPVKVIYHPVSASPPC